MIVAVEGPSAAGKTTWCARFEGDAVVPEYAPTGCEPDGKDLETQAAFWVGVNIGRWVAARAIESAGGVAVCDSDPLKLHYSWCLARIGAGSIGRWERELRAVHRAFEAGQLGFADLVLVHVPDLATLRARKAGDRTRSRRSFELHARLREPLQEWYRAVDGLEPGRVWWGLPGSGVPTGIEPRQDRSDPALLDALVDLLPGLTTA
ncbi:MULTISPECIES: hypothetical protein [unclassified Pseudonocardia]|uniref:hypothetical protein n=1 Tax=unclassified Pseudonocardia TaxID=2619320 RepID=UPI00094B1164|nr:MULTISPECIES: hypothetical protein [unclassified Pseudonocardia]OLL88256.1 hypothetical protein Ae263Ps1_5311c [Pseudonocardia sp. Ae263_Ps1]OLL91719.1 hypothetical protein Ae356Ps1_1616 [Pseudonocardia sp. Ae356_Ps1]